MSNNLTAAQLKRREEAQIEIEAIRKEWPQIKKHLDRITELVSIPGVDAARVFFVVNTQNNELDTAADPISRWTDNRLVQVEALEALNPDQKVAIEVDEEKVADMAEK